MRIQWHGCSSVLFRPSPGIILTYFEVRMLYMLRII